MTRNASTDLIGGDRPLRVCDLCGGVDDHPRHVLAGGDPNSLGPPSQAVVQKVLANVADLPQDTQARLLTELHDRGSQDRHRDCCREAGCPNGECDLVTLGAESLRGKDLLDHTMSQAGEG